MQRLMFAAVIALLAVGSAMIDTSACAAEPTAEQREAMQVKVEELRSRLALTPEQEEKIAPLVHERNEKFKALRAKSNPDASKSEKRALLQEARAIQDDYVARVEPLLTQEQKKRKSLSAGATADVCRSQRFGRPARNVSAETSRCATASHCTLV